MNSTTRSSERSSELLSKIRSAQTVWLTTHPQADGDGLACEAAMAHALKGLGKNTKILNFEPISAKYRFLFERPGQPKLNVAVFDPDLDPAPPDVFILFDTK
ncbi:MAG: hypothetical protein RBT63_09180, partial [Bdellovibrionales bacterium]|nr:hypothetical protein [Bdellovibrionales bacterium]